MVLATIKKEVKRMGQVTDDMILEAVIMDGTPSRSGIYDYVAGFLDLPRNQVVTKAGARLRSLVKYGFLTEIRIYGQYFYCFPDCKNPAPIVQTQHNIKGQIHRYIQDLPKGSTFTVRDIQRIFGCSQRVTYESIHTAPNLSHRKAPQSCHYIYTKGASA